MSATNTLIVKRLIQAPRERLFAAWANSDDLLKWFGPPTCQAVSVRVNVVPGGEFRINVRSEIMGEVDIRGVYREVVPGSRLSFTWNWSGNPVLEFGESLVAVDFLAVEGATDLHITHTGLPNASLRDDHTQGWNGCLEKLERFLGLPCREQPAFGGFCWNELQTSDASAAAKFYTPLFDWQAAAFPNPDIPYTLFKKGGRDVGGLMTLPTPEVPPHWLAYVHVADVDALVARATSLGGKVMMPPMNVPTVGRLAILQDPQGAVIGVFKPVQA